MSWRNTDAFDAYGDWSEDEVRARPPKSTRPRSKQRPAHEDAVTGFVTAVDRGRYSLVVETDGATRAVTAARARELGRKAVVTGDRVDVVGDVTGDAGTLARIVRVEPRTTVLRRSADDSDQVERVIVANADQLCLVVAAANPEPRPRLIDRTIVAAYDAGIAPMVVITKTDLADPSPVRALLDPLDIPVFELSLLADHDPSMLEPLRRALEQHVTVMIGHSGVGKSTLVNALVPDAGRATGHVNEVTGRGRHTSSSSLALPLAADDAADDASQGWIIDTPGVRSFGLGHVAESAIFHAFPQLETIIAQCPRGCTHRSDAPDCELDAAIANGRLDAVGTARVASLRRLLDSLDAGASHTA